MNRREFIQRLTTSTTGFLVPGFCFSQSLTSAMNILRIPQLDSGTVRNDQKHFSLTAQTGNTRFFPDFYTATIGLNGSFLGPTLRFKRDDNIAMHVENALGEPMTLHWHGLHVPARADGGPAMVIEDNGSWNPRFKIMQQAGTFWYHSHLLHKTGDQVYRGLSGMIIIDDDESLQTALPSEYAVDDIPLIVQDRRFNQDGSLRYTGMHSDIMTGLFGDTILVNGTLSPIFTPSTSKVRFRLLNAANARTFTFAFDDGRRFHQVASDGALLQQPVALSMLELAPSERAEIVVDFSDGKPVNLVSLAMAETSPFAATGMMRNMHAMNSQPFVIMAIEPQSGLAASSDLPSSLTNIRRIQESEAVRTRQFTLSMAMGMGMRGGQRGGGANQGGPRGMMMGVGGDSFFINGKAMDSKLINETVKMGDTEIWEISNDSMMMHPFHIHHTQFQILDRNGQAPAANELGLKDSVKVGPGETVRFILHFENFSDAETPYMYHCHILEHEDNGMMGQFLVV